MAQDPAIPDVAPLRLTLSPLLLSERLGRESRERNMIWLDFDADVAEGSAVRIDLNVAFVPCRIRKGVATRVDYYVGCTGAVITLDLPRAKVGDHTPSSSLDVEYSTTIERKRRTALSLSPKLSTEGGDIQQSLEVGSVDRKADSTRTQSFKFASKERELVATVSSVGVMWNIDLPHGEKAVRDFLEGNLYLYANCDWNHAPRAGTVSVRPSDVRFFGPDRKPLSRIKSLFMECSLRMSGRALENRDGFSLEFAECEP
jgi:hypothetical protein